MFEKIVSLIERAVVALEKLAIAGPSPQSDAQAPEAPAKATRTRKQPEATPAPPADDDFLGDGGSKEPEVTYERADVKQALQDYGKKNGMDKAQALFQKVGGVKALSDLPIEKFAAVIEATKK